MTVKFNPYADILQIDTDTFTQLKDTPDSYATKAYYIPNVEINETALAFSNTLNLGDCIFTARETPDTPDPNSFVIYTSSAGTTPNKVVEWKLKDEEGTEVILYSIKI
jgi:hypothetical protein